MKSHILRPAFIKRHLPATILLFFVFSLMLIRVHYGLDWSDETYVVALASRIASGQHLFVELWDAHQLSGLISGLFVWIYTKITGGLTGVLLYVRVIACLCSACIAFFAYSVFSKHVNRFFSIAAAIILQCYFPFSIFTLHYNYMLFASVVLSCLFILKASYAKNSTFLYVAAGVFFALGVLANPFYFLAVPVFLFAVFYTCRVSVHPIGKWKPLILFLGGGAIIALLLLFYLAVTTGFTDILNSWLYSTSGRMGNMSSAHEVNFLTIYLRSVQVFFWPLYLLGLVFALASFYARIRGAKWKDIFFSVFFWICVATILLDLATCAWQLLSTQNWDSVAVSTPLAARISLWVPLFVAASGSPLAKKTLVVFWLPSLITCFIAFSVAFYATFTILYMMILPTATVCLCLADGFSQLKMAKNTVLSFLSKSVPVFAGGGLATFILLVSLFTVYRDGIETRMDVKLEQGPAKGLYTNGLNARDYNLVYEDMNAHISSQERLLPLGLFGIGFLMTDAIPASPVSARNTVAYTRLLPYYQENPNPLPDVIYVLDEEYQHYMIPTESTELLDFFEDIGYTSERTNIASVYRRPHV